MERFVICLRLPQVPARRQLGQILFSIIVYLLRCDCLHEESIVVADIRRFWLDLELGYRTCLRSHIGLRWHQEHLLVAWLSLRSDVRPVLVGKQSLWLGHHQLRARTPRNIAVRRCQPRPLLAIMPLRLRLLSNLVLVPQVGEWGIFVLNAIDI